MASSSDTTQTGRRGSIRVDPPNMSLRRSLRRLVLVGLTGAGKSSSGNTILGRGAFRVARSASSVTKECSKQTERVAGREITVVDTPGLFDTGVSDEILEQKISKCINMTAPGPHAIILVIKLGPLTEKERLSVEKIRAIFGEEADKHTIVLFTHGDQLTSKIEKRIREADEDLKEILRYCGGRYHVFNNKHMEDRNQVVDFLEKVDDLVSANEGRFYTSDSYKDVEDELKNKEEKLRREFKKKLQDIKRDLEARFSEEQEKLDERFKEFERYYDAKIREARLEAEQSPIQKNKLQKIFSKLQKLLF